MRRDEIDRAALRLFREKGYHATSMQDIADAVGMLKGSLYQHISSKEELLEDLFEHALATTVERLRAIAAADESARSRLERLVRAYVLAVIDNFDAVGLYLREWRSLPPPGMSRVRARRRSMRRVFEDVIREGAAAGAFRETDPTLAALAILGMCNWIHEWYRPSGRLTAGEIAASVGERALTVVGSARRRGPVPPRGRAPASRRRAPARDAGEASRRAG